MTAAETYLKEQLIKLQRNYQELAKPIIARLVQIEACKPSHAEVIMCASCERPLLPGMACTECGEERDSRKVFEARRIAAEYCREVHADGWARMYESGEWDNQPYVVIALRAMGVSNPPDTAPAPFDQGYLRPGAR